MSSPAHALLGGRARLPEVRAYGGLLALALALGVLAGVQPKAAAAAGGIGLVIALTFLTPVAHLTVLLLLTAVVPYTIQNAFSVGGGSGVPGLLVADLLLATGLLRAALVVGRRPLERRRSIALGMCLVFLAAVFAQAVHGWLAGANASEVGYEARALLGWGVLLVAMPIVSDEVSRRRLFKALTAVGLVVGLWGLAQWVLNLPFDVLGEAGVRPGVSLTSGGRGQVQGGLFAFPIALLVAFAALLSGQVASMAGRVLLSAVIVLNAVSILLTYERSFWVGAVVGGAFVALKAGRLGRFKALVVTTGAVVAILPILTTIAPGALTTARERLLSLGLYASDSSVRYRVIETRNVMAEIRDRPLLGSGLGATIYWGRPYAGIEANETGFSHNAVLWLWWKLGAPVSILILVLIGWSLAVRGPPVGEPLFKGVRDGAQGGMLAMLIVSVTFTSLAQRPITPILGLLLAICLAPLMRDQRVAASS